MLLCEVRGSLEGVLGTAGECKEVMVEQTVSASPKGHEISYVNGTGKPEVVARDGPALGRASAAPTQEATLLKWQLGEEI